MPHTPRTKEQIIKELFERRNEFDNELEYFAEYKKMMVSALHHKTCDIKIKIGKIEDNIEEVLGNPTTKFRKLTELRKQIGELNLELSRIYKELGEFENEQNRRIEEGD